MKFFTALLLFSFSLQQASAATIGFSANIPSEDLAEEAISLLRCLSEQSENPWELSQGGTYEWNLNLKQVSDHVEGSFQQGEKITAIKLQGNGKEICRTLFPPKEPAPVEQPKLPAFDEPEPRGKSLLLGSVALAVIAGGIFLWARSRPDHRSLKME